MSRILFVGDSSFTCQASHLAPFKLPCRLARCGVLTGLATILGSRAPEEDILVLNFLSSFSATSLVGCIGPDDKKETLTSMLTTLMGMLSGFLTKTTSGKIFLLFPLSRYDLPGFNEDCIPFMVSLLTTKVHGSGFSHRITLVPALPLVEKDYVHDRKSLTLAASQRLITYIIEIVNARVTLEQNLEVPRPPVSPDPHRLATLREDVDANTKSLAISNEKLCHTANLRRANDVLIMGLKLSPMPTSIDERKEAVLKQVADLAGKVFGEVVPPFSIFIRAGIPRGTLLPPVEVKFMNSKDSEKFRRGSSQRARGTKDVAKDTAFSDLYFSSILTLATRVRIEIMKAIARELASPDMSAYAPDFGPRPLLIVQPTGKPSFSELYMDAIEKYGHLVDSIDL